MPEIADHATVVPKRRYLSFLAVLAVGLAADLVTKWWVFRDLGMPGGETLWFWQGHAGFRTSLNPGALFGIGAGWTYLFISLSFVAIAGIFYWVFRGGAAADPLLPPSLGAITAGILGNLYDRLGLPAYPGGFRSTSVRDFLLVQINEQWQWPIFNIADSLLVCGVGVLIFHAYVLEPRARREANADDDPASQPEA